MTWTASIGSSSGPQAFPFHIFAICFFTSSNESHSTGPSVVGSSSSCSLGCSALKSLSKFCFHLSLIFPDSVKMVPCSSLTYAMSRYISTSSVSTFGKLVYYLCSFSCIQFSVQFLICCFFCYCYCSLCSFVGFLVCTVLFFTLIFLVCFERPSSLALVARRVSSFHHRLSFSL